MEIVHVRFLGGGGAAMRRRYPARWFMLSVCLMHGRVRVLREEVGD